MALRHTPMHLPCLAVPPSATKGTTAELLLAAAAIQMAHATHQQSGKHHTPAIRQSTEQQTTRPAPEAQHAQVRLDFIGDLGGGQVKPALAGGVGSGLARRLCPRVLVWRRHVQAVLPAAPHDMHAGHPCSCCRCSSLAAAAAALPLLLRPHARQRQLWTPAQVGRHVVPLLISLAVAAFIAAAVPGASCLLLLLLLPARCLWLWLRLRIRLAAAAAAGTDAKGAVQGCKHLLR